MASFNTTTYDISNQSFNFLNPIYINAAPETTSADLSLNPISISGINYYNGLFGNVMCSFAVDGGDSVLGGNVIIAGDLSCCARVAINGNASITGNLFAASDVSFQKRLFVGQDTSLNGKLYVKNDTSLNGNVTITGNIYLANLPTCSVMPSLTDHLVTKNYIDSNFVTTGAASTLTFNTSTDLSLNARLFIGYGKDASLNGNLYVLNKTINQGDVSINSRLFVALDCSVNGNLQIKGRTTLMDCSFNGKTTFITLPTSTVVPTTIYQLVNKNYVDSCVTGVNTGSLLGTSNTWTGTNTFNSSLPKSTVTPTLASQLVTKTYVDTAVSGVNTSALVSSNNTWTGTNTFTGKVGAGDALNYNIQYGDATSLSNLSTPSGSQAYANTAIGHSTLNACTTGYNNTAISNSALHATTTGFNNIAVGGSSLVLNTSGSDNMAVGSNSLSANTTGSRNTSIGSNSTAFNQTGNDNIGIGYQSLTGFNLSSPNQNVAIGSWAGSSIISGSSNTMIGYNSGLGLQNNTNCTCIGATSNVASGYTQSTVIGYGASTNASNQIVLGTATETVSIPGAIKLNNTASIKGMACGKTAGTVMGTVTVSFGVTFTNIPVVTATIDYGGVAYTLSVLIGNVTTTSFMYNIFQFSSPTAFPNHFEQYAGVNWIAMGT